MTSDQFRKNGIADLHAALGQTVNLPRFNQKPVFTGLREGLSPFGILAGDDLLLSEVDKIATRRADSDEETLVQVNAGTLAEVRSAGCPPGTLVEVRDLFCNVPARRKFLRAYATEEGHIKQIFTIHALAHPAIAFSLTVDGRELYKLAPASSVSDRIRDLFGDEFLANALPVGDKHSNIQTFKHSNIQISGFIEKPNLSTPSRRDQYVFVNGRPATSASIAYALREAYPRRAGDSRPAAVIFIDLPPNQVDVNVHPTKREVRFRDNVAVKNAIMDAVGAALCPQVSPPISRGGDIPVAATRLAPLAGAATFLSPQHASPAGDRNVAAPTVAPAPVPMEFAIEPDSTRSKPWQWFRFLAQSASGYLLIETDSGIVTINPHAARERIAYEKLLQASQTFQTSQTSQTSQTFQTSQTLLIPETVKLTPVDAARIKASLPTIAAMGFQLEEFGRDTFKIDAVPQLIGSISPSSILSTIASDLSESGAKRGDRWRDELIAKSIAKSFAGAPLALTEDGATRLVEELCACRMPYVCPRGKPVMIFTSTRELDRKFARN